MHSAQEGKSLAHDNDSKKMCGDHSLKGAMEELREDHAKGVPHLPVGQMKGLVTK